MSRLSVTVVALAALVALIAVPGARAQTFPAPGTGTFTWERVGDRPLSIVSFSFSPGGSLFGGGSGDSVYVFEPAPGGAPAGRWRGLGYQYYARAVLALDAAGDTLLIGSGNGALLLRSTDGGATWVIVNAPVGPIGSGGPDTPDGFHVVPAGHPHAGRILAGGAVIYSDDRGATWLDATSAQIPGEFGYAHVFTTLPSGRVLMSGNWGVAATNDGGATYDLTPVWGEFQYQADGLTALATPGSTQAGAPSPSCGLADGTLCDGAVAVGLDATAPDMRAWRTNDGGRSWSAAMPLPQPEDGIGLSYVAGVVSVGTGPDGLGRAITVLGRGVVYATADGGQTWRIVGRLPLDIEFGAHWARLVRLGPDGHLWVSTVISGPEREWLYRSAEPAEAAFPVAGETLPAEASGVGVAVRPNPASGRVAVSVSLAEAQTVRVAVFDATGREVAVPFDGMLAAGEREVPVETGTWPAGVYVVRVSGAMGEASARFTVAR